MNELITKCLEEKDITHLVHFPSAFLSDWEKDIIEWILNYSREFSEPPSVERMSRDHPYFVPLHEDPPIPIDDINKSTLKRKRKEFFLSKVAEISDKIPELDDVPMEELSGLLTTLGTSNADLARYSTFDRDSYFRSNMMKIGFPLVDRVTGGLGKGEVMVVSGRLGTGKSTITEWITFNWWQQAKRMMIVSLEMLAPDIFSRIDGMLGRFNPLMIRTEDPELIKPRLKVLSGVASKRKGEIFVAPRSVDSPAKVAAMASHLDIDALIIDGMYLLKSDERYAQKWERVASVSNSIKQIAMDLKLPTLATTQIKRGGVKDEYDPEDLAYSDAIGQDADFVVALHPSKASKQRVEIQLIKNRYGPLIGSVVFIDFDSMTLIDESIEGRVDDDD